MIFLNTHVTKYLTLLFLLHENPVLCIPSPVYFDIPVSSQKSPRLIQLSPFYVDAPGKL